MKRTKQDYLNLLEETVNYYSEDTNRRATNTMQDCYYYKKGKMCAVGRCLENPQDIERTYGGESVQEEILIDLKEQYKGYNINFWNELQCLHDNSMYWSEEGLTVRGEDRVNKIKIYIEKVC